MNYCNKIQKFTYSAIVFCFLVMTVLVLLQTICRYVLGISTAWAQEIAMYCFVWWVFLASTIGLRKKLHLGVDVFTNLIEAKIPKLSKPLDIFREILIMAFLLFIFVWGVRVSLDHMDLKTPVLEIPLGLMIYLVFPIFSGLMIIFTIESVLRILMPVKKCQ